MRGPEREGRRRLTGNEEADPDSWIQLREERNGGATLRTSTVPPTACGKVLSEHADGAGEERHHQQHDHDD
jgi:hypothetical protein